MPTALAVLAHPDDAEFLCAGTLLRLRQEHGYEIHIASMTPGDCGSTELPSLEIARLRRAEGAAAAELVGGRYWCLEESDLRVDYRRRTLERTTRLLRLVRPTIVFTHAPSDYMLDHEQTSDSVRAATFAAPIPNLLPTIPVLSGIPHFYYCDPIESKTPFGDLVTPSVTIDVTRQIETKAEMLARHVSQREWLRSHHGMDHYLEAMRDAGRACGTLIGVEYAESFRQHRGHGYPQDDLLARLLEHGVRR